MDGDFLLRQLPTIPVQEEEQINLMKKYYFLLPFTGILLFMLLVGCAKTRNGKVELSDEKLPNFLKVGTTRAQEVLEQIGEPFGNREQENRSAMIFIDFQQDYVNLLITKIRREKAYRLDLVFQDDILQKAEIKKEGWGFGANMDPKLLQLMAR